MKLYYDNLISFMPDSIIGEDGAVVDEKLKAARSAMIMLADFQNTHNVSSLYKSVAEIAVYAGVDIVDLMLSLSDVRIEDGEVEDLLDIAAKNLFKTVTITGKDDQFDYRYYSAILLTVAHRVLDMQRKYMIAMANAQTQPESAQKEPENSQ